MNKNVRVPGAWTCVLTQGHSRIAEPYRGREFSVAQYPYNFTSTTKYKMTLELWKQQYVHNKPKSMSLKT